MAPPPSSELPLTERVKQLAQTLQFAWFVGHLTLLLSVSRYGLSYLTLNYYSKWAKFSYRLAFVSAAATYGIVVYKAYRARLRSGTKQGSPLNLISDENVQYLLMALVWLYSRQLPLALLPFAVYSIFHVATYTRTNLIPTFQPPKAGATPASPTSPGASRQANASPLANAIGKFVKEYYDASMMLVAGLEIALWIRVFLSAVTFSKGSWVLLVVYSAFLRARYAQSQFHQGAVAQGAARIDAMVSNQSTPPAARQGWETTKGLMRQVHDATDLRRYVGASQAAKKPQ
ncbi:putative endoplasmic reticulum protein [Phaeomoniella chlamydospora]|uniref:Putative endoplasmic reticulum protein n=1 Tax=Phaeomoniella chlamydospora TaxID=158046 RepID=A0A0G2HGJ6_PHACM|nr:putative endoplasmic reticulum protein [Phaeomoniella chlamydospora]